jgi:hypothetical protein
MKRPFFIIGDYMIKPIPEYPGYFADEDGNIWTNRPRNGVGEPTKELRQRKISVRSKKRKYKLMYVCLKVNGVMHKPSIAYLVLTAFVSPRPEGMQICHGVNRETDNSLKNLSWGTPEKNNGEDKVRDGTQMFGEKNHEHKLNELQVRIIRKGYGFRKKEFLTGVDFGRYFNVTPNTVMRAFRGETWKHIR